MPDEPLPPVTEARTVARTRTRMSPVWIIPLVAAAAGVWVAVTRILAEGPEITITLSTAEGLEAGKTKIHYNGVDVGTITNIRLSDDHRQVVATAQMEPKTESFLVTDTKFWVVDARISGANVSGLGTLISGAYLGMEIGRSTEKERAFVALESPPVVTGDAPGRFFVLKAPNLGSLDYGTPVYFRRLQVGEVASYQLDPDGTALTVKIFVRAPYDRYVTTATRFWQASGVDVSLTANGLSLQTQSLLSILIGGIAFESATGLAAEPAPQDSTFPLYGDRAAAFTLPVHDPQTYVLVFTGSVRGLSPGAPVEFHGVPVGQVLEVGARIDAETFEFTAPVTIVLDAQRLGVQIVDRPSAADFQKVRETMMENLIAHGVRAQLQSGNLLTGALYVSFATFPDAPPATIDWSRDPVELPTVPNDLDAMEASVASILKKVDQLPIKQIGDDVQRLLRKFDQLPVEAIGEDLRKVIAELDRTLASARGTLDNADRMIAPGSVLATDLGITLDEVTRAARGVRVLADYLERHPEALIRGKSGEAQ